ncbi:4-(cytidine 5'-diphospho)-2-C-methyl-D-erythritol kinase [Litoreibacter roseus]|uniref:4-diphosphocytidyl-2-C-methyl-D-erythritol kinase n=1 Tax=Litoreibacter roseus TaxID=2601869 RepID=A0A6N6JJR6_9RHOB|nr:4-(cytidine 5'-diphospho)-2-C-methyl-D-erythritol kinase [Litoreibacter roseus]GFE66374.1 4-diphosphocytidyl-2-C-methyl-D-erythritol kinase [Litoreibacter roseus]
MFAPAKVNLSLHIVGQRDDGYHLLDSLVMFATIGDHLNIFDANTRSLTIEGPEAAGVPTDTKNSIMQAAEIFKTERGVAFLLAKHLPTAAGIGGGSADAAAALRGLLKHWFDIPLDDLLQKALDPDRLDEDEIATVSAKLKSLGADLPVCLFSRTARMWGIGEQLSFLQNLPQVPVVLVNPRVPVSTPDVFARIAVKANPPMPDIIPSFETVADFAAWLAEQRNDMQDAAIEVAPIITDVLAALAMAKGCHLARMSGSGATCFGIYDTEDAAQAQADVLSAQHPNWWIKPAILGNSAVGPKLATA